MLKFVGLFHLDYFITLWYTIIFRLICLGVLVNLHPPFWMTFLREISYSGSICFLKKRLILYFISLMLKVLTIANLSNFATIRIVCCWVWLLLRSWPIFYIVKFQLLAFGLLICSLIRSFYSYDAKLKTHLRFLSSPIWYGAILSQF